MKTHKSTLTLAIIFAITILSLSCTQEKVDPALVLDEILIPNGYMQVDNPPADALARLGELRQQNPKDHYYYIHRINTDEEKWIFPQKELKIEFVAQSEAKDDDSKSTVIGAVVKKIKGNWKSEEFMVVENQSAPIDGMKAFYHYIQENLKYPDEAKKLGVEGKVFVQFIVDEKGKLTDVKAVKGIGAGCDEEAVRVIKEAEAWNPAMVVDIPVKTRMIIPITYKLN